MNREIRVGDIVRITTDRSKAEKMWCIWVDELEPWLGRLGRVIEYCEWPEEESLECTTGATAGVCLGPLEVDEALGILSKRDDGVDERGWWFDNNCVELVEVGYEPEQ